MLAINGLIDPNLIARSGLNWKELKRLLTTRSVGRNTVDSFAGNYDGTTPIKNMDVIYDNDDDDDNNNNSNNSNNSNNRNNSNDIKFLLLAAQIYFISSLSPYLLY